MFIVQHRHRHVPSNYSSFSLRRQVHSAVSLFLCEVHTQLAFEEQELRRGGKKGGAGWVNN